MKLRKWLNGDLKPEHKNTMNKPTMGTTSDIDSMMPKTSITKTSLFKYVKILLPKNEHFKIKILIFFKALHKT